jgi:ABC-2 type transport system permease protein
VGVHLLRLGLRCVGMSLRTLSVRRESFILGIFGQFFVYGAEFLLIWLLVARFHLFGGWKASEVLLLFSLNLSLYGLAGFFFFSSVLSLGEHINRGTLDQVLTKPIPSLFGLVFFTLNFAYVTHVSLSLSCLVVALAGAGFAVTFSSLTLLLLTLAGATLIQASPIILCGMLNFWSNQAGTEVWAIHWDLHEFIKFPLTIYPLPLQVFLTFVAPLGFISYYPAERLLGKSPGALSFFPEPLTPLIGMAVFALALCAWLRRYESTGS